jgi:hypothetical protein
MKYPLLSLVQDKIMHCVIFGVPLQSTEPVKKKNQDFSLVKSVPLEYGQ